MAKIQCKICGGRLELSEGMTAGKCGHCGNTITLPCLRNDRQEQFYNLAEYFRHRGDFDQAQVNYNALIRESPNDPEAYWGFLLSRCGIRYENDPSSGNFVPVCVREQSVSILADPDYLRVLDLAAEDVRGIYEAEAAQIAAIQKILQRSAPEEAASNIPEVTEGKPAIADVETTPAAFPEVLPSFTIETDNPLLVRVQLFLETGDFASARQYCERILDEKPENGYAYFYWLMAERKVSDAKMLVQVQDLSEKMSFKLAHRFSDPDFAAKLDELARQAKICGKKDALSLRTKLQIKVAENQWLIEFARQLLKNGLQRGRTLLKKIKFLKVK